MDAYVQHLSRQVKEEALKDGGDLLGTKLKRRQTHPLQGYCYFAVEVIYHLLGAEHSSWTPYSGVDGGGITHWWLQHNDTGEILDPTSEQYEPRRCEPPYEDGHPVSTSRFGNISREGGALLSRLSQGEDLHHFMERTHA